MLNFTPPNPCPCGKPHTLPVEQIIVAPNAAAKLPELTARFTTPVIICDENTKAASYPHMADFYNKTRTITLSPSTEGANTAASTRTAIHADNQTVAYILSNLPVTTGILIAVGTGIINDLTRFVAGEKQIPFISVPTAASVDGFVSNISAMTWHGMKKSFYLSTPLYVVADTNIFAHAPYRLTASGISDLLGKHTALADWKIAAELTGEYFCQYIHDMVKTAVTDVESMLDSFSPTPTPDSITATEKLMHALLVSGIAMQYAGCSRPASGAEHHISHLWEMNIINDELDALHGEKVSIGLLLALEKYNTIAETLKSGNYTIIDDFPIEANLIQSTFGKKGLYSTVIEENCGNPALPPADTAHSVQLTDKQTAAALKQKTAAVIKIIGALPSYNHMKQALEKAGCLTTMSQIGLNDDIKELSLNLSPYAKNRITLMRLAKLIKLQ